jgi:hypothetical protein
MFLWPDGHIPTPIRWEDHRLGSMKYDRVLDESRFWRLDSLLEKVRLGVDWATQVVTTVPVETLRATVSRHRGTPFWYHVIQVLPRGAWVDAQDTNFIHYNLEGSLWMLYYEVLTHLYTIQRLKRVQGLPTCIAIPRVGYLTLPEYTGEATAPGACFVPQRGGTAPTSPAPDNPSL